LLALAAAGSLGLHVAVLALPLGTTGGEESFAGARAPKALHAKLHFPAGDARPGAQAEVRAAEPALSAPPPPSENAPAEPLAEPVPTETREPMHGPPAPSVQALAPTSGVVPIPDDYFDARKLTEAPRPLTEPPLAELERIVRNAGEVRMMLFIDESGRVAAIDIQSATLAQDAVARAAEIFSEVRFSPGRIGKMAVKSRVGITVGAVAQRSYRE
jgi:hypothetical protein